MPLRSMMPLNLYSDPIVEAVDDIEHDIILHQSEYDFMSPALWAVRMRQCFGPLTINHHDLTVSILLIRALMGSYAGSIHDELWGLVLGVMQISLGSHVWLLSFGILYIPQTFRTHPVGDTARTKSIKAIASDLGQSSLGLPQVKTSVDSGYEKCTNSK